MRRNVFYNFIAQLKGFLINAINQTIFTEVRKSALQANTTSDSIFSVEKMPV